MGLGRGERVLVEPPGFRRAAAPEPEVPEHDGGAERVGDHAGRPQAGDRFAEPLGRGVEVARRAASRRAVGTGLSGRGNERSAFAVIEYQQPLAARASPDVPSGVMTARWARTPRTLEVIAKADAVTGNAARLVR